MPRDAVEFAGALARTLAALDRVRGDEKFKAAARKGQRLRALRVDHHALADRQGAGAQRPLSAFRLDEAEAAGGGQRVACLEGAEVRDVAPVSEGDRQEHFAFLRRDFIAVDEERNWRAHLIERHRRLPILSGVRLLLRHPVGRRHFHYG